MDSILEPMKSQGWKRSHLRVVDTETFTQNPNNLVKYWLPVFASHLSHPTACVSNGNPRNLVAMFRFGNRVPCLEQRNLLSFGNAGFTSIGTLLCVKFYWRFHAICSCLRKVLTCEFSDLPFLRPGSTIKFFSSSTLIKSYSRTRTHGWPEQARNIWNSV